MSLVGGGLTAKQARKQRRSILRQQDRERVARIRGELRAMRLAIREARRGRRARVRAVRDACRAARLSYRERIARLREEVRELVRTKREAAASCGVSRTEARATADAELAGAVQRFAEDSPWLLEQLRMEARARKITPPKLSARERRAESDHEVEVNVPPELLPVWHRVKHEIREGARISRTEAFLEWAAANGPTVERIQNEQHDRELRRMIREEAHLAREASKLARRRPTRSLEEAAEIGW